MTGSGPTTHRLGLSPYRSSQDSFDLAAGPLCTTRCARPIGHPAPSSSVTQSAAPGTRDIVTKSSTESGWGMADQHQGFRQGKAWMGLVVIAILMAGCGGAGTASSHPPTTTSSSTASTTTTVAAPTTTTASPTGRLAAGFKVEDLTWISSTVEWALGTAPCAQSPCTSIAHTVDGGRTWTGLRAPVAYIPGDPSSPQVICTGSALCVTGLVTGLRFATSMVGYVFGPSSMWITTDGGEHWTAQSAADVASLEIDGGATYRVTYDSSTCPPGCNYQVQRSAVGSSTGPRCRLPRW